MGYDLHITRAPDWLDSQECPISREEWDDYARQNSRLREEGAISWKDIGEQLVFSITTRHGVEISLSCYESRVDVSGVLDRAASQEIAQIAEDLDANLFGDDGERYETRKPATAPDNAASSRPGLWARLRRSRD